MINKIIFALIIAMAFAGGVFGGCGCGMTRDGTRPREVAAIILLASTVFEVIGLIGMVMA